MGELIVFLFIVGFIQGISKVRTNIEPYRYSSERCSDEQLKKWLTEY